LVEPVSEPGNMLDEKKMADITAQMLTPLGLSEENMQVFKELLRNILADSNHKKR